VWNSECLYRGASHSPRWYLPCDKNSIILPIKVQHLRIVYCADWLLILYVTIDSSTTLLCDLIQSITGRRNVTHGVSVTVWEWPLHHRDTLEVSYFNAAQITNAQVYLGPPRMHHTSLQVPTWITSPNQSGVGRSHRTLIDPEWLYNAASVLECRQLT